MISLVMTTYNGLKYISEQLESIKNQTVLPDEVLIYDSFLRIQKRVYEKRKDCLINTKLISSVMMVRYLRYYGQTRFWMTDLYYVLKNKHK